MPRKIATAVDLSANFPPLSAVLRLREAKTFDVHGVVTRAIERRFPEQRRVMLDRCGRASAEIGDHARAAKLLHLAGLRPAAASEFETYLSQQDPQTLIRWADDGREYAYNGLAADRLSELVDRPQRIATLPRIAARIPE